MTMSNTSSKQKCLNSILIEFLLHKGVMSALLNKQAYIILILLCLCFVPVVSSADDYSESLDVKGKDGTGVGSLDPPPAPTPNEQMYTNVGSDVDPIAVTVAGGEGGSHSHT